MPDSWELADYLGALRRRWWIVAALTIIGLLGALAALKVVTKSYTATAGVYVTQLPTEARPVQGSGGLVDLDNEAQLVTSQAVVDLAARHLRPSPSPQQLVDNLTVSVPPNTTVLNIACDAPTASGAASCANAVSAAYLTVRLSDAVASLNGALSALQAKAISLTHRIGSLRAQIPRRHAHAQSNLQNTLILNLQTRAASSQLTLVLGQSNSLTAELATLQAPHTTLAGHVINAALPPSSPTSPKKPLLLGSGVLGGLIIGLLVAFSVDVRDERLRRPSDVERFVGVPVWLTLRRGQLSPNGLAAAAGSPPDRLFAELAQYVLAAHADGRVVLLVAGASPEAGVSLVAANLAAALAEVQPDVLLVRADREGSLADEHIGANHSGDGADSLPRNAATIELPQSAAGATDPVEGATTEVAPALRRAHTGHNNSAAQLRSRSRYLIVEMPLTNGPVSGLNLTAIADAAIVVIESRRTLRGDAKAWGRRLERMHIPVLGAVMVPRPPRRRVKSHAPATDVPEPERAR